MATINVFIKGDYIDKRGEAPILLDYFHQKSTKRFKTNVKVNPKIVHMVYDPYTELFRIQPLKPPLQEAAIKKIISYNTTIQNIQLRLKAIITDFTNRNLSLSASLIEREYNTVITNKAIENGSKGRPIIPGNQKTVLDWYKEFIECKESEIGGGINAYRSTWRHFKMFLKKRKKAEIFFTDLRRDLLNKFREYLAGLTLDGTTIHKQFHNFSIFINWVKDSEEDDEPISIPSAYKKLRRKIKARYGDPIGLSVSQFLTFFRFDLTLYPELERTRDLFVFGISVGGTRHGDLRKIGQALRKHGYNLQKNSLTYFEGKTGNAHFEIAINKFGLEILKKYPERFPYVPSNQRMNINLKRIASLLEWNELKFIPKYNEFGKLIKVNEKMLKSIISTKFMRKTAATIDNYLKISPKTSMSRTGHKTFAAYSRYVDVNKEALTDANQNWDELFEAIMLKIPKQIPARSKALKQVVEITLDLNDQLTQEKVEIIRDSGELDYS